MHSDHDRESRARNDYRAAALRLSVAGALTALIVLVALIPFQASASVGQGRRARQATASAVRPLTKAQIVRLIKKYIHSGPQGPQGATGAQGPTGQNGSNASGGPPSGPAGGALAGSYPDPTLNVSGGPCANGQALTNISSTAALTCRPGVYSDNSGNVAAGPNPFNATHSGGGDNVALGFSMMNALTTGISNVASGRGALSSTTSGDYNVASGANALFSNTTGNGNVASGLGALYSNTTANDNVATGDAALGLNTTGTGSVASGAFALQENTTGNYNVASGYAALDANTTGGDNVASGHNALLQNTSGGNNVAIGVPALSANTTGSHNVASGENALLNNTTGSYNTALGIGAGSQLTTGSSNVDIANFGVAGEANTIRIGSQGTGLNQQNQTFLAGVSGSTSTSGVPVLVNSSGQLGTTTSSRRFKRDIRPLGPLSRNLMALRPVSFHYKARLARGQPNPLQFGLIAEQVNRVFPNLVEKGSRGRPYAVRYQELPALLLAQVQRQQRRIGRQQAEIRWLRKHVQLKH
jgi:hypothetical protein